MLLPSVYKLLSSIQTPTTAAFTQECTGEDRSPNRLTRALQRKRGRPLRQRRHTVVVRVVTIYERRAQLDCRGGIRGWNWCNILVSTLRTFPKSRLATTHGAIHANRVINAIKRNRTGSDKCNVQMNGSLKPMFNMPKPQRVSILAQEIIWHRPR
jgi:hypothetical protein